MTNAQVAVAVKNAKSFRAAKEIVRDKLRTDQAWQVRTLMFLFDRQTAGEQSAESTELHNEIGFNSADSRILTGFAKQWLDRAWFSDKQMGILQRKIVKYAGQVALVMRGKAE